MTFNNYTNEGAFKEVDQRTKDAVAEVYNMGFEWPLYDQVAAVLKCVDLNEFNDYYEADVAFDIISEVVHDEIVYTDQKWIILEYYTVPECVDLYEALSEFTSDIITILKLMLGKN